MQVRYGSNWLPVHSAAWRAGFLTDFSPGGIPFQQRHTVRIDVKMIQDGGPAAVAAKLADFQRAFSIQGQDLVLHLPDGRVASALRSATSLSGVRIVSWEEPEGEGGFEFVSGRTFRITAEATYPLPTGPVLLAFQERVSFQGNGGPVPGAMQPVNSLPIIQTLTTHSACLAIQSGKAVGLYDYPTPPPVIWPRAPRFPDQIDFDSGEADGLARRGFGVSWVYRFLTARPLSGLPHQWPRGQ